MQKRDDSQVFSPDDLNTLNRVLDQICPPGTPHTDREAQASALFHLLERGIKTDEELFRQLMADGIAPGTLPGFV